MKNDTIEEMCAFSVNYSLGNIVPIVTSHVLISEIKIHKCLQLVEQVEQYKISLYPTKVWSYRFYFSHKYSKFIVI